MNWRTWLLPALLLPALALPGVLAGDGGKPAQPQPKFKITWKKTVLSRDFYSEGVAVVDVNKDGKLDVIAGEVWFEAPTWKKHVLREDKKYDPLVYSNSFCCYTGDFNGDGWQDVIIIPYPGEPCYWYENPQNKPGPWKKHLLWHSACNETPQWVDLFKNGQKVLIMGWQPKGKGNQGQMAYFTPGKDPTQPWEMHPISEPSQPGMEIPGTQRYSHGLGVGDMNGDGRLDVICTGGWWEQPEKPDGKTPWKFHKTQIGQACADMFAVDVDRDGLADVISTSAHGFGIWWHQQRKSKDGKTNFVTQTFFKDLVSQTHALHFVDINGDGLPDLVTGRRWWAHGPKGDPGSEQPAVLYWFEARRAKDGMLSFVPHLIDDDSGIGTQFVVLDINGDGLLDIIISNKKGTFIFEQVRTKEE
jgi:hypothetical protein